MSTGNIRRSACLVLFIEQKIRGPVEPTVRQMRPWKLVHRNGRMKRRHMTSSLLFTDHWRAFRGPTECGGGGGRGTVLAAGPLRGGRGTLRRAARGGPGTLTGRTTVLHPTSDTEQEMMGQKKCSKQAPAAAQWLGISGPQNTREWQHSFLSNKQSNYFLSLP